jgi:hypothetical protein
MGGGEDLKVAPVMREGVRRLRQTGEMLCEFNLVLPNLHATYLVHPVLVLKPFSAPATCPHLSPHFALLVTLSSLFSTPLVVTSLPPSPVPLFLLLFLCSYFISSASLLDRYWNGAGFSSLPSLTQLFRFLLSHSSMVLHTDIFAPIDPF